MKNYLNTVLTAVSATFATICFLSVANPEALSIENTTTQQEMLTAASNIEQVLMKRPEHTLEKSNIPQEKVLAISNNTDAFGTDPFLGEIVMFAGNFAPRGWAFCNGQLLPIAQNSALFSILGTNFGGDGRTTFGLPNLRGRVPLHAGGTPGRTGTSGSPVSAAGPGRVGNVNTGAGVSYQEVNYIIALSGTFPSRS